MNNPFPYNFIAIEGNLGAGKTTLCQKLQENFNCKLLLEQFADNPFLANFYENQERYAFPVELFFMTERHKQLQEHLTQRDLFQELIVADYFFVKTLLFAKNNLNAEEYRLFQRLFKVLNASFPKPDLLVFLHRSVEGALSNIKKRGRDYEQDISKDYLQKVQDVYYEYIRTETSIPILIIDVEKMDFLNNNDNFEKIVDALQQTYSPGVHHLSFVSMNDE
ncbi:MAG TPA: deoxynucleoside kinase [Phaeodactylibacter sp.]|nr:deoxynucleoside kinase [Phaeodactylibacter sp.]